MFSTWCKAQFTCHLKEFYLPKPIYKLCQVIINMFVYIFSDRWRSDDNNDDNNDNGNNNFNNWNSIRDEMKQKSEKSIAVWLTCKSWFTNVLVLKRIAWIFPWEILYPRYLFLAICKWCSSFKALHFYFSDYLKLPLTKTKKRKYLRSTKTILLKSFSKIQFSSEILYFPINKTGYPRHTAIRDFSSGLHNTCMGKIYNFSAY